MNKAISRKNIVNILKQAFSDSKVVKVNLHASDMLVY